MPIKHQPWPSDDDRTPEMRLPKWYGALGVLGTLLIVTRL
jgi:hypothetical protein